jgi:hypothetical protein
VLLCHLRVFTSIITITIVIIVITASSFDEDFEFSYDFIDSLGLLVSRNLVLLHCEDRFIE